MGAVDLSIVLDLVNRARVACMMPTLASLPKGVKREGEMCPLYRALPGLGYVGEDQVQVPGGLTARLLAQAWGTEVDSPHWGAAHICVSLPEPIRAFVEAFDNGELPDLIDEEEQRKNDEAVAARLAERTLGAVEA